VKVYEGKRHRAKKQSEAAHLGVSRGLDNTRGLEFISTSSARQQVTNLSLATCMPPIIGWAVTTAQVALRHVKMDSDYSVPAVITSQDLCEFILKNTLEEGTCGIVIRPLDLVLGTRCIYC